MKISSACEPEPENQLSCVSCATSKPSQAMATLMESQSTAICTYIACGIYKLAIYESNGE
jgi:hypothetical protein